MVRLRRTGGSVVSRRRWSWKSGTSFWDQFGALGLVLNAVVLWNTRYTDAAVSALRAEGHPVRDEDVARLSPLGDAHINMLGRYAFAARADTGLRPLPNPQQ